MNEFIVAFLTVSPLFSSSLVLNVSHLPGKGMQKPNLLSKHNKVIYQLGLLPDN